MRRTLLIVPVFAMILASVGCKSSYVAGRCDCTYDPASSTITAPANPYPVINSNAAPAAAAPAALPEKMPMPK
jgi:hypothetical protein